MKKMDFLRKRIVPAVMALGLVSLSSVALASCSDDDDDITPSKEYVQALKLLYPTAQKVTWEKKGAYTVGEFRNQKSQEMEVWFDGYVQWSMTTIDYERDFSEVPEAIIADIDASEYSTWYKDGAEYVERRDGKYYVIEVEQQGSPDTDLVYKEDGTFVNAVPGQIKDLVPETVFE